MPTKIKPSSIVVTGDGISAISASVDALVNVKSYDENGVARTTGGDIYFIHVMDRCQLNNNYYCEETSDSSNIMKPPILKQLTDNNDGTYETTYLIRTDGIITVDVVNLN